MSPKKEIQFEVVKQYYTLVELAVLLGTHPQYIRTILKQRKVPHRKRGEGKGAKYKFHRKYVEVWVKEWKSTRTLKDILSHPKKFVTL